MSNTSKYRLLHFPQIPCKPFVVESDDLQYLVNVKKVLVDQHLFLFENKMIPDYCNTVAIQSLVPEEYRDDDYFDPDSPYWDMDDDDDLDAAELD